MLIKKLYLILGILFIVIVTVTVSEASITYTVKQADLWDNGYNNISPPRQSNFSRFVFTTNDTSVTIGGTSTLFTSYPQFSHLGVRVNGVNQPPLIFTANSSQSFVVPLGTAGTLKVVEIISGLQSNVCNPAGPVVGSFVDSVTYANTASFTVQQPTIQTNRILVYGDSISVGGNCTNPESEAYVPVLRNTYNYSVMCEGWGCRTFYDDTNTAGLQNAFVSRIAGYNPSVIWFAIGTNDYGLNKWNATSFGTTYASILDALHTALPSVKIVCQTPIVRSNESANSFGDILGNYRNQIITACYTRPWTTLVDGTALLTTADLDDGLHPTTAGHAKYASKMNDILRKVIASVVPVDTIFTSSPVYVTYPGTDESTMIHMFTDSVLLGNPVQNNTQPSYGLELLEQDYADLSINKNIVNGSFQIGSKQYSHGLGTHSFSKIRVRLPNPGKKFDVEIGVDNAAGTSGSVIFAIEVGTVVYRSGKCLGGQPFTSMSVNLNNVTEFYLDVLDAGDGYSFDYGDWGNPIVTYNDNSTQYLDAFPVYKTSMYIPQFPLSFTYNGVPSSQLLPTWTKNQTQSTGSDGRELHTVTYSDPSTGLTIECDITVFNDNPSVEWVVWIKNNGTSDTPILDNIMPLNLQLSAPSSIGLNYSEGSLCQQLVNKQTMTGFDFQQYFKTIYPGTNGNLDSGQGQGSSDVYLPFFNLQWSGGGLVYAIGWSGWWKMNLVRGMNNILSLQTGQQITHMKLHPGESIRTPRMLLLYWQGNDRMRGHNRLRQLILNKYSPKNEGQLQMTPISAMSYSILPGGTEDINNSLAWINATVQLGGEAFWLDAGWYPCPNNNIWPSRGTWDADTTRFPQGLKPVSDACHANGLKFICWFDEEFVAPNTYIWNTQPGWLIGGSTLKVFNFGIPAARQWMTNYMATRITNYGIDICQHDCNGPVITICNQQDAFDRQGITENFYIQGLYAYWDALLQQFPGFIIANCCSGGRRIDLEMLSRSLVLWESDAQNYGPTPDNPQQTDPTHFLSQPVISQMETAGLNFYVPFHTGGVWHSSDPYWYRSIGTAGIDFMEDIRSANLTAIQPNVIETKNLRQLCLGDYYFLTDFNYDETKWVAWQFDRQDLGQGFATFFRRASAASTTINFSLKAVDPAITYNVTFDGISNQSNRQMSGAELQNVAITISNTSASGLLVYQNNLFTLTPTKIVCTVSQSSLLADNVSVTTMTATVYDNNNNVYKSPVYITFSLSGPGTLIGSNPVYTTNGVATIWLKSSVVAGVSSVTAEVANKTNCIRFKGTATGAGNQYNYRDIVHPSYTTVSGDKLEYDIFIPRSSTEKKGGVELEFSNGQNLRGTGAVDQNNLPSHPATDLSAYAVDDWYHRIIPITVYSGISAVEVVHESDIGVNELYVRNIKITNGTSTKIAFYNTDPSFSFSNETAFPGNVGYQYITLDVLSVLTPGTVNVTLQSLATKLSCSATPTNILGDGSSSCTVICLIQDANGNTVTTATNQVNFSITGPGILLGVSSITAVNGIATIRVKSTLNSGTVTITASGTGLINGNTTVNIIKWQPLKILSIANPTIIIANGINVSTITAMLADNNNQVVLNSTNTVTFSLTGQGTWEDGTILPRELGVSQGSTTITVKSSTQAGNIQVTANSTGLTGSTVTITTTPGLPTKLRFHNY